MKKRLCLFMMALLLFMSAGCSQATTQMPETSGTEMSATASGSTTVVEPDDRDDLDTDAGSTAAVEPDDGYNLDTDAGSTAAVEPDDGYNLDTDADSSTADPLPDSPDAGFSDNESDIVEDDSPALSEDGSYTSKEDVALYIHLYGHLPSNFITKKEAEQLGWSGGSLEPFAPGMCIGGSRFGNYEGLLPQKKGRSYTECDIDTLGADKRGAKRIVFSNDGLIYYTEDHYQSFELLYGEPDP